MSTRVNRSQCSSLHESSQSMEGGKARLMVTEMKDNRRQQNEIIKRVCLLFTV